MPPSKNEIHENMPECSETCRNYEKYTIVPGASMRCAQCVDFSGWEPDGTEDDWTICHSCGKYWWHDGMHSVRRPNVDTVFICPVCWNNNKRKPQAPDPAAQSTAPKNNLQEGKVRLSLLPLDVLGKYLVPAYEEGVIKYERESWRQGFHVSVLIDAALRHITEFYWHGKDVDPDSNTGKNPLAGALFCLLSALHTLDTRPELDDRPGKGEK